LCFIQKIRRRSLNDIAFAEFDRNLNFIPDNILPDVVTRLKNQENYSPYRMNFIGEEIINS